MAIWQGAIFGRLVALSVVVKTYRVCLVSTRGDRAAGEPDWRLSLNSLLSPNGPGRPPDCDRWSSRDCDRDLSFPLCLTFLPFGLPLFLFLVIVLHWSLLGMICLVESV